LLYNRRIQARVTLKNRQLVFVITLSVITLCLLSQINCVDAAAAYEDEFAVSTLQSCWNFINPAGTGSHSLTAHTGYLRITAPTGSALGSNFNAPRLLQPVTNNFVATTCVSGTFSAYDYRAGLLLWKDDANYMRIEKYGSDKVLMWGKLGGTVATKTVDLPIGYSYNPLYLKLDKTGTTLTGFWSRDDSTWNTAHSFTFNSEDPLQIGLLVINVGTTVFSADFDYFHVYPATPDPPSVLPEYPLGLLIIPVTMLGAFAFSKLRNQARKQ
jgi:regulation of enolase protein 1 (concanavalin A-like superfamily)